ncbi:adp-l-glycero-d-manno-heptose-6-epimerase : ADP-L-glycero-D-manno-heptose-6-epimerase OS=Singulisphaera acidiphila (strain ATCC BAA-1392 / DSM 18658 / VKM B-2454 / MOB10) GN=Sinac_4927 PE=4 SV=1: Epimerase [Gemmata massiliana]|uniref:ADP-L-glycero-D-manno-heptose-6-epimerase n=1 Tax=Gemmata massiliana TaxID=1210884 RepID=A0A6P2D7Y8_9BACT|nr:ADP-glyceromanno-heptose 6-epimerase [Gemmata massiliana]VTR97269.1 adp-l-glycero-d-manno-heptose-6-epimerase : ADP-L-glycero-D-manno-heptose-6-epimerase OS=Singulisphaera acidiphila (strain ATCC BAA-1392 / DSM 18658 / VKM B-2454 / MOB10) GN=Sinac_4927 PE=4 SV=1: Epimerase [Gemmata massiliana]
MIAVTGAAGFIGSNLAHRLAAEGHSLLLVDHELTAAKAENFVGLPRFAFSRHDHFLDDLTAGRIEPDAIFHLGACSSTTETSWDYLLRNNVEYTRHLWEWCAQKRKPLFYASSAATYGDGSLGFDDHTSPGELRPLNLYGKSKNDFDIWALAEVAADRPAPPKWAGLKFFNVYGPRESHKGRMASVVYQTHKQIKATGEMKLFRSTDPQFSDGGQRRDFVFVGDCVNHLLWLWRNEAPNGVYNSGSGEARTFYDLARGVFTALGLQPRISFIDMPRDLAGKYQNFTRAEMQKLRGAGCDVPATALEEGVRETVQWLEHGATPGLRAA